MRLGQVIREFRAVPAPPPGYPLDEEAADGGGGPGGLPVERGVVGWRFWRVGHQPGSGWHLASVSVRHLWMRPGVWDRLPPSREPVRFGMAALARAMLLRRVRAAGFHAFKSGETAYMCATVAADVPHSHAAFGACELLGHTIEHEDGYRSQGMAVRELYLVTALSERDIVLMAADLERRYACEVHHAYSLPWCGTGEHRDPPPDGTMPAWLIPRPRAPVRQEG